MAPSRSAAQPAKSANRNRHFNSQQNRLFGDGVVGEDGEAGTNGKMTTVAAVADTAAVADERGDGGGVRVRCTFIDSDEGGTANHKGRITDDASFCH